MVACQLVSCFSYPCIRCTNRWLLSTIATSGRNVTSNQETPTVCIHRTRSCAVSKRRACIQRLPQRADGQRYVYAARVLSAPYQR
jgi:hypothetical protein